MNEVELFYNKAVVGSYLVAQGLERTHKNVLQTINDYCEDFEDFGVLKTRKLKSTGGRAANEYLLDEDQFMFLGTLLKNTKQVVAFKKAIILQFKKCRLENEALQRHKIQPEYQITRDAGKIVRNSTTDTMKKFVVYAEEQGSKSADRYYTIITTMLNRLLFTVEGKYKNLREVMTVQQLMTVSSAERIIDRGLIDGMNRKIYYKAIFIEVRDKVELFIDLHGKSHVLSHELMITPTKKQTTGLTILD
jgi:phage regulator Rha-like protein